jgi:ligand-binding sensor domain-containing protein/signal transduction histidine kinase
MGWDRFFFNASNWRPRQAYSGQKGSLPLPKIIFPVAVILCFTSCSKIKQEIVETVKKDSLALPRVTRLADLPDSLKPKAILLKNMPKPLMVAISSKAGHDYTTHSASGSLSSTQPTHSLAAATPLVGLKTAQQGVGNFTTFTTDDGLALDDILCGFKDKTGTLWLGTQGSGVSRYDGQSFTTFSSQQGLVSDIVGNIMADKRGNLWFAADEGGVSRYDGQSFTTFSIEQGLAGNTVLSMAEDKKGNIWFATNEGVSRYDGHLFTTFSSKQGLANNWVLSIAEDKTGNLWFGTLDGGVSRYDGQSFSTFSTQQGLANNNVRSIVQDGTGNIWFGTLGGVSRYDGRSFTTFSTQQGLASDSVWSIVEDKTGNLWFGTERGVSRYNGRIFTTFSTDQGLTNNRVLSITEDNAGNLWFGTYGGGVSRYNGESFSTVSTTRGLASNIIWSIVEDKKGNLWFCTEGGGVSRFNGQSFTTFSTAQGLVNNTVFSVVEDKTGSLWFGTAGGGVSRYDGLSFTTFSTAQGLANDTVYSIVEDKTGSLWFGTERGVSRYDGQSFTTFSTAQGLANRFVLGITEDKAGNLWFGTLGGVSRYDGQSFTTFSTAQGLAHNIVFRITEDKKGNLWFASAGGVSLLSTEKLKEKNQGTQAYATNLFENFTAVDGLPDNAVTQVMEGDSGKMYLGTNVGICELVPSTRSTKGWVVGHIYNSKTGYPVKDVNTGQNTMFKDSRGIIWIGTGSVKTALVRFDPSALTRDTTRVKLVIQQIKIDDQNICWHELLTDNEVHNKSKLEADTTTLNRVEEVNTFGRLLHHKERVEMKKRFKDIQFSGVTKWYFLPENLVLPYSNNNISFSFNAIEISRNFLITYQYMLEGYDKDWTPLASKTTASFSHLPEGTYTFKLKSRNYEGVWSTPIAYTFSVLPPWWRTWWMYVLYVGLAGSLFFSVIKWREQKLKGEKLILEETVASRTKQLDERNSELQKLNSTKDKFFSIIGHDLKGPINSLTAFSNLLIVYTDKMSKEEIRLMAIDFDKTLKNVSLLLENLLNWARSQSGNIDFTPEAFDLTESLKKNSELLKDQASNKNIRIERVHSNERIEVRAHKQSVDTIIRNLISNAIKFTLPGGLVTIGTQLSGNEVIVSVKDTGIGISAEVLQKLFRLDVKHSVRGTANEKGTGLGLLLCKEFVEKNGGRIWVESAESEGSLFQFSLPLAQVE